MEGLNYESDASTEGVMGDVDPDRGDDLPTVGNGHGAPALEELNVGAEAGPGRDHGLVDAALRTQLIPVAQGMDSLPEDSAKLNAAPARQVEQLDSRLNRVEYIDEIYVPQFTPSTINAGIRRLSHVERRWKGADWSLLLIINPCYDTMVRLSSPPHPLGRTFRWQRLRKIGVSNPSLSVILSAFLFSCRMSTGASSGQMPCPPIGAEACLSPSRCWTRSWLS